MARANSRKAGVMLPRSRIEQLEGVLSDALGPPAPSFSQDAADGTEPGGLKQ